MPLRARWVALLLLLAGVFAGLRWVAALPEPPEPSPIFTDQVVVVGVTGRPQLTEVDRQVIGSRSEEVQAGAVSIRTRYVGECAAAGWATLGAGRRTTVDEACVGRRSGTGRSSAGTGIWRPPPLAAETPGWAPWPGRSTAAWPPSDPERLWPPPDRTGRWPRTRRSEEFIGRGMATTCPITLVDAGDRSRTR